MTGRDITAWTVGELLGRYLYGPTTPGLNDEIRAEIERRCAALQEAEAQRDRLKAAMVEAQGILEESHLNFTANMWSDAAAADASELLEAAIKALEKP